MQIKLTWNLVQSAISLNEACQEIPATGKAVKDASHDTGWNANSKDSNHLVPGAAQHDLLSLEGHKLGEP